MRKRCFIYNVFFSQRYILSIKIDKITKHMYDMEEFEQDSHDSDYIILDNCTFQLSTYIQYKLLLIHGLQVWYVLLMVYRYDMCREGSGFQGSTNLTNHNLKQHTTHWDLFKFHIENWSGIFKLSNFKCLTRFYKLGENTPFW